MSAPEHSPGVSELDLVLRTLKLLKPDPERINAAIEDIDQLYGLDCVEFDEGSSLLRLAYDASHLGLEPIEQVLSKHGIKTSQSLWSNFKTGFYRYVDQNVKDNKHHKPRGCHKK